MSFEFIWNGASVNFKVFDVAILTIIMVLFFGIRNRFSSRPPPVIGKVIDQNNHKRLK